MSDLATRLATTPLSAGSAAYVEELYARYLDQPDSVPAEWQEFFANLKGDAHDTAHAPIVEELRQRANLSRSPSRSLPERAAALAAGGNAAKQGAVSRLIQIYMNRGHLAANIDPLGLAVRPVPKVMRLDYFGLTESDLDTEFFTGSRNEAIKPWLTLREILAQGLFAAGVVEHI